MNKLTNIVIPIYFQFIHFWYILHPNNLWNEALLYMIEI